MSSVFLIGGGWNESVIDETYGLFIRKATSANGRMIAIVLVAEDTDELPEMEAKYRHVFGLCGVQDQEMMFLLGTPQEPIDLNALTVARPTGVFVGGGLTPLYHQQLCSDLTWLAYLKENNVPYAGFSAGAAIASEQAIVGGWQIQKQGPTLDILDEDFNEGLDLLEIRPGLGLNPFSVDVHASQWGTVTRLMHAVDLGLIQAGWAIDENTSIEYNEKEILIHGSGSVYNVQKQPDNSLDIQILNSATG